MTNPANYFQVNRRDFLQAAAVASWSFNRLLPSYRPRYRRRSQDIMKQINLMDYPQFIADLGVKGLEFSNHQIPTYGEDYLSVF